MTEEEIAAATITTGVWRYDGRADMPVSLVGLPFDYWQVLAEADGELEKGEKQRGLGPDGLLYHVRFAEFTAPACSTIAEAKALAESLVSTPIRWTAA